MRDSAVPLSIPSAADIKTRPNTVLLEPSAIWRRPSAEFVLDQSGASPLPELLAEQPHERHGLYATELRRALVFGHHHLHAFITEGNRFDCQEIGNYQGRLRYHIDNHPGRHLPMPQIAASNGHYAVQFAHLHGQDVQRIDGRVLFASPTEPLNWGMWLLQALPIACEFVRNKSADRLMIYAERPWQQRLLAAVGVQASQIAHQDLGRTYHCPDLRLLQYTQVDLVPTPLDRELFARVAQASGAVASRERRIFLSRRSVSREARGYRALLNEDALLARVAALGFEIHEPEQLPFRDQVALFREARVVAGLGGAALFNTVFCQPGTRVVSIESSDIFVRNHAMLFGSLDLPFGIVIGTQDATDPTPIHKRWTVDVGSVAAMLQRF